MTAKGPALLGEHEAERADVVVVGGGIAGMMAALAAAGTPGPTQPSVVLVTEGGLAGGCSRWAQGGIAVAIGPDDSPDLHRSDTVIAGRGLCREQSVRVLVEEGPARLDDLRSWGVAFDCEKSGALRLGQEAAHSRRRIVHAGGDSTGAAIVATLAARVRAAGIHIRAEHELTGLLAGADGAIGGVVCTGPGGLRAIVAPSTVLATGGAARLWRRSTNPAGARGVGVTLAYLAGAEVEGMEFVQFHPTATATPGYPAHLVSEAMRGEGASIVDGEGRRFLFDADPRGELAPRDVVASAIWAELARTGASAVFLDTAPMGGAVAGRFPGVAAAVAAQGLLLGRDRIPIAPAAHYSIGGVRTDLDGLTSVDGLLAAGEVASTGVHGANRLASNSLLEGAVFGWRAGQAARMRAGEVPCVRAEEVVTALGAWSEMEQPPTPSEDGDASSAATERLQGRLHDVMWENVGLIRDAEGLDRARDVLYDLAAEARSLSFHSSLAIAAGIRTASLVVDAAHLRTESRGSHQRSDHPLTSSTQDGSWLLHSTRGPHRDRNA